MSGTFLALHQPSGRPASASTSPLSLVLSLPAHVRVLVHRHAHVIARLVLDEVGRALQALAERDGVLPSANATVLVLQNVRVLPGHRVNLDFLHLDLRHCVGPASERHSQLPLKLQLEVRLHLLLFRCNSLADEVLGLLVVHELDLLADLRHVDLLLGHA